MRIYCIFKSGRIIDRTDVGEHNVREVAEEFPTINYFFAEPGEVAISEGASQ